MSPSVSSFAVERATVGFDALDVFFASCADVALCETPPFAFVPVAFPTLETSIVGVGVATTGFDALDAPLETLEPENVDETFVGVATTGFGALDAPLERPEPEETGETLVGVATTGFGFKPQLGDDVAEVGEDDEVGEPKLDEEDATGFVS